MNDRPVRSTFWKTMPSGLAFDFANPRPEMVRLDDIVHVLARINRWGGNIEPISYSVAQHSLVTAQACKLPKARVYALLHDAAEAYIGELTTPLKLWIADAGADIVKLEKTILFDAIFPALKLGKPTAEIAEDVHQADQVALATEHRDIVRGRHPGFVPKAPPLKLKIRFQSTIAVEDSFRLAVSSALHTYREAA